MVVVVMAGMEMVVAVVVELEEIVELEKPVVVLVLFYTRDKRSQYMSIIMDFTGLEYLAMYVKMSSEGSMLTHRRDLIQ